MNTVEVTEVTIFDPAPGDSFRVAAYVTFVLNGCFKVESAKLIRCNDGQVHLFWPDHRDRRTGRHYPTAHAVDFKTQQAIQGRCLLAYRFHLRARERGEGIAKARYAFTDQGQVRMDAECPKCGRGVTDATYCESRGICLCGVRMRRFIPIALELSDEQIEEAAFHAAIVDAFTLPADAASYEVPADEEPVRTTWGDVEIRERRA